MHPDSLEILRKNHDCMLLDCTYKTNRYNLPLLNIVGCTSQGTTFQIAVMLLKGEKEEDYYHAMQTLRTWFENAGIPTPRVITTDRELALINALGTWFPEPIKLLYRWHVNMNVVKHCKPLYPKDPENPKLPGPEFKEFYLSYIGVVEAPTETVYIERLSLFRANHKAETVEYVEDTWLTPYRDRLVRCYVDQ